MRIFDYMTRVFIQLENLEQSWVTSEEIKFFFKYSSNLNGDINDLKCYLELNLRRKEKKEKNVSLRPHGGGVPVKLFHRNFSKDFRCL